MDLSSLSDLLDATPIPPEDPGTAKIISRLAHVKRERRLSRSEFIDCCHWKSPRAIHLCERTSARKIQTVTSRVFATQNEQIRIEELTSLPGVGIPTASAILMLSNPKRYGVLDIRVWQVLYTFGSVTSRPSGRGFAFNDWHQYLQILRYHAARLKVNVRSIERTLFEYHQDHQVGTLYRDAS